MFGWFRSKQDPKLIKAFETGRKMAQSFAADLDKLMEVRFKPAHEALLGVIQGRYNECMSPTDVPPIIAARIEYKIFLDNIGELRVKMTNEITTDLSEWLDVADQMQLRDTFTELIAAKIDQFIRELSETAFQRLLDMAHALKLADDQWRAANPEISAKIPSDT